MNMNIIYISRRYYKTIDWILKCVIYVINSSKKEQKMLDDFCVLLLLVFIRIAV